ncbi:MAG: autoinducer synthase [Rhodospirillales bacterium]|nr:autoinducer synthase [Rhodospirillales bacterium]MCB9994886.1 autoinducer synthase [Rhodospirillales bacterium]
MILAVSIENAHLYGDILPSIYRLRYHGFKERQNYAVPSYNGMEYDTYDTPATTYLAWRDGNNVVRGCARLFPTTLPYMIEEIWPSLVGTMPLPKTDNVWEASRLCIDKSLPPALRKRIQGEILCALQEFGLHEGVEWMIGVMTYPIWRTVFIRSGWPVSFLGAPLALGPKEKILSGKMDISVEILQELRRKLGISGRVLMNLEDVEIRKRA